MKRGQRVVCKPYEALSGFTPYKSYEVVAGEGDINLSAVARRANVFLIHTERTFNVVDDNGVTRFVSLQQFKPLNEEIGSSLFM